LGAENGRRVLGEKLLTAKVAKNIREGRKEMPERLEERIIGNEITSASSQKLAAKS
jgi:hypothetical protein